MTGISTGALNAGGVAQFAIGNEKAMADFLITTWTTMNGTSSTFVPWEGGIVEGIFFQRGIYNNKPLFNTLNQKLIYGINRNITIGSTNLDTGIFSDFSEDIGPAGLLTAIGCSACPPWYFPPTNWQGSTWVDGGCTINLDVFAAVNRCLEVVSEESQITVDQIYDSEIAPLPAETNMTTLYVFARVKEIRNYDSNVWFQFNVLNAFPKVNYRYTIIPSGYMPGGYVPLDFNQTALLQEIELGKSDVQKILASGQSGKDVIMGRYQRMKESIIYA